MRLLAIDPGNTESAYVLFDTDERRLLAGAKVPNDDLLNGIDTCEADAMAVEMIASYGMAVGAEVFDTCVWIGRFIERWNARGLRSVGQYRLVYRREVKLHLCGQPRAKDANIRQALIDLYGGKEKAIGKKANPGPLYGVSGDVWSALGVAVTAAETRMEDLA